MRVVVTNAEHSWLEREIELTGAVTVTASNNGAVGSTTGVPLGCPRLLGEGGGAGVPGPYQARQGESHGVQQKSSSKR